MPSFDKSWFLSSNSIFQTETCVKGEVTFLPFQMISRICVPMPKIFFSFCRNGQARFVILRGIRAYENVNARWSVGLTIRGHVRGHTSSLIFVLFSNRVRRIVRPLELGPCHHDLRLSHFAKLHYARCHFFGNNTAFPGTFFHFLLLFVKQTNARTRLLKPSYIYSSSVSWV